MSLPASLGTPGPVPPRIGPAEAAAVRAEGERLIAHLDEIVPTGWEGWRPDHGWPALELPEGWDRVDEFRETR